MGEPVRVRAPPRLGEVGGSGAFADLPEIDTVGFAAFLCALPSQLGVDAPVARLQRDPAERTARAMGLENVPLPQGVWARLMLWHRVLVAGNKLAEG